MSELSDAVNRLNTLCAKINLQQTGKCPQCGYPEKSDLCAHDKPLPTMEAGINTAFSKRNAGEIMAYLHGILSGEYPMPYEMLQAYRAAALTNAKPVDTAPLRDDKHEEFIDRAYVLFYRHGKPLGQIAEELNCGIYDLSPWLYRAALLPTVANKQDELLREARNALDKLIASIPFYDDEMQHIAGNNAEQIRDKITAALAPQPTDKDKP